MTHTTETIVAIATPPGRGGIGIVRISGTDIDTAMRAVLGARPTPRMAQLSDFLDEGGEALDRGLALYFPAPHSYTGEHVLELHCHGSPPLLDALVARICKADARPARPGEFTERAFLNGKLDLAQAEAVADLIDASSTQAVRSAQRSLQGVFSDRIVALVDQLVQLRTQVEAGLDFPDEDIEPQGQAGIVRLIDAARGELDAIIDSAGQGARLRDGLYAVICGRPNVGKSSLLNRLARADRAIVTEQPGTTRDTVHEDILVDGCHISLADTAGIRDSGDRVEREGVQRSLAAIEKADLVLLVVDDDLGIGETERLILEQVPNLTARLVVHNKIDRTGREPGSGSGEHGDEVWLSAKTGAGMDLLSEALLEAAGVNQAGEDVILARRRHLQALAEARAALGRAADRLGEGMAELGAEDLRLAQESLNTITGRFGADDLLGEIFAGFCIGK